MQEPGLSKLVSVRFDPAPHETLEAPVMVGAVERGLWPYCWRGLEMPVLLIISLIRPSVGRDEYVRLLIPEERCVLRTQYLPYSHLDLL